ncbi:MAG: preprotein translocase subunit SecE [Puniceicoccales bacterium]|nr:preprotein translocase subunit SecE [Puniceicoccales bacterium]
MTNALGRTKVFLRETILELRKTSWPSRAEFKCATAVVLWGTLVIGGLVSLMDFSLFQVTNLLLDVVR